MRRFHLALYSVLLRASHIRQRFGKPFSGAAQDGDRHFQIALHLFHRRRFGGWHLPLRFQKQLRLGENVFADCTRALPPSRVQLPGLPRVATMCNESRRHARAVGGAHSRHRHQILRRHLRRKFPIAYLLLDRFRQQLHQPQSPRYPTGAAVETSRQFVETIAEAPLHFCQQPALFQRAFPRAQAQRPRQQHGFGFAHGPNRGFHRFPAELFQRGDTLVAVDHKVTVRRCGGHHDDGRLLTTVCQRRQQTALPVRITDSQMSPSPVQLVKLQLHRFPLGIQYGGGWN